jgi:16S rRNA (guanine527-N7)-methyltransferase
MLPRPATDDTRDARSTAGGAAPPSAAELQLAAAALRRAVTGEGLAVPAGAIGERLTWYLALLARWRRHRRIAGPASPDELAVEAIADALRVDEVVPPSGTLFDIGSGAGLPGIPLALLHEERLVTLVEPATARAALLRVALSSLALRGRVVARRAEDFADDVATGREAPADTAVARAFRPPGEWLALGRRLVRPGGGVIVLAGRAWPGPSAGSGVTIEARVDYTLAERGPRTAWRLRVG